MDADCLQVLIDDCDALLALTDAELAELGETRENVESARSGCVRDLAYLQSLR